MLQIHLQPPEPFNFKNPDNWAHRKHRFQQFLFVSGLQGEEVHVVEQVSMLVYCLGEEAETVLNSTNDTEAESKGYKTMFGKFDALFKAHSSRLTSRVLHAVNISSFEVIRAEMEKNIEGDE